MTNNEYTKMIKRIALEIVSEQLKHDVSVPNHSPTRNDSQGCDHQNQGLRYGNGTAG